MSQSPHENTVPPENQAGTPPEPSSPHNISRRAVVAGLTFLTVGGVLFGAANIARIFTPDHPESDDAEAQRQAGLSATETASKLPVAGDVKDWPPEVLALAVHNTFDMLVKFTVDGTDAAKAVQLTAWRLTPPKTNTPIPPCMWFATAAHGVFPEGGKMQGVTLTQPELGTQPIEADWNHTHHSPDIRKPEPGNGDDIPHDFAVLGVPAAGQQETTGLPMEPDWRPQPGKALYTLGFPQEADDRHPIGITLALSPSGSSAGIWEVKGDFVNYGASGSPVLNEHGQVVAIIVAMSGTDPHVAYATPITGALLAQVFGNLEQ